MASLDELVAGLSLASAASLEAEDPSVLAWSHGALPATPSLAEGMALPVGVLVQPVAPLVAGTPTLMRPVARCRPCGAAVSPFDAVELGRGTWTCSICGARNEDAANLGDANRALYPELASAAVEIVRDLPAAPQDVGVAGWHRRAPLYVFVVDEHLPAAEAAKLRASIVDVVATLDPSSQLALVSYAASVSVFDLTSRDALSAHVFSGRASLSARSTAALVSQQGVHCVPQAYAKDMFGDLLQSVGRPKQTAGRKRVALSALGVAIEVAQALIEGTPHSDSRIMLVCASAPSVGPGEILRSQYGRVQAEDNGASVAYYGRLAQRLVDQRTSIDAFLVGYANYGMPVLRHLLDEPAGHVFMYKSCDAEIKADLTRALHRDVVRECRLTVRCAAPLAVARVIGLRGSQPYAAGGSPRTFGPFEFPCVSEGDTIAVYFELAAEARANVRVQVQITYENARRELVTRVFNLSVPVLGAAAKVDLMGSVRVDVTAVLAAREHALAASKGDADVGASLSRRLGTMLKSCGSPHSQDLTFGLPATLQTYFRSLYDFSRGPLLGQIVQHPDDILCRQLTFLRLPLVASMIVLSPCLYHVRLDRTTFAFTLERVPLVNLALSPSSILLLDEYASLFVWVGGQLAGAEMAPAIDSLVQQLRLATRTRLISPVIMVFPENHSMSRFMVCRLSPLHKDPPFVQRGEFPQLANASDAQLRELAARFNRTDEPSFLEYARGIAAGRR